MKATCRRSRAAQMELQASPRRSRRDRGRKVMTERLYNDASPNSRLAALRAAAGRAQPAIRRATANLTARQQLEAARQQLARLELRLTAEHPDVIRTRRDDHRPRGQGRRRGEAAQASPDAPAARTTTPEETQRRERVEQPARRARRPEPPDRLQGARSGSTPRPDCRLSGADRSRSRASSPSGSRSAATTTRCRRAIAAS